MKKTFLLLSILILFVLTSCYKEYNKQILGKWCDTKFGNTYTFFPDNTGTERIIGIGSLGMKDWPLDYRWSINGDVLEINYTHLTDRKVYRIIEINQNDMQLLEDPDGIKTTKFLVRPDKY